MVQIRNLTRWKHEAQYKLLLQNVTHKEKVIHPAPVDTDITFFYGYQKSGAEKLFKTVSWYILGVIYSDSRKIVLNKCTL